MEKIRLNKKPEPNILHPPFLFFILFILTFILSSCGYSNPYVIKHSQETPSKTLLITTWQNRTNELGLESMYFRLLNSWFKNSSRIQVIFDAEKADLKLTGEITAIDLPGLFYGPFEEALEINIRLTVQFTLYDNRDNSILWQEKRYTVYESFIIDPSGESSEFNKQRALLRIGDEIAELIYLRTQEIVSNIK
jgi:hypothetical protein